VRHEHPVRLAIAVIAPLLAIAALATYVMWESDVGADSTAGVSLISTAAALIASAWAVLIAPSRVLQVVGVAALVTAFVTAALWWRAATEIWKTT
jgi:hypothetical protein